MEKFTETEIKYLAGLIDADGYVSFSFVKGRVYLQLGIVQSVPYDRDNYLDSLVKKAGRVHYRETSGNDQKTWTVRSRRDLNILIPRLVNHMVIKARHLNNMFNKYLEYSGVVCSSQEIEELRNFSKESRIGSGPLKPKTHPTWAWVSGYLDGDGHYNFSKKRGLARLEVCAHVTDTCGIELLQKAFGGTIVRMGDTDNYRWFKNLGKRDKAFAKNFLKKMHRHSKFKRWKIEQILAFHNQAATTECEEPRGASDSLKAL